MKGMADDLVGVLTRFHREVVLTIKTEKLAGRSETEPVS
jgi:hypothetical protein